MIAPELLRLRTGFYAWLAWYDGLADWRPYGKRNPDVRPKVPRSITLSCPQWWPRRAAWWALRRMKQDPLVFWRSQGGFVAWGANNADFIRDLPDRALARGLDWVAVQDTPEARAHRDEIKAALHEAGIKLVIWHWATSAEAALNTIAYWSPDAYIANVEHQGPWDDFTKRIRGAYPALPLAVITNFAGVGVHTDGTYDIELARPWWTNGFACITESYMVNEQGPQPSLSPERLDWTAKTHLGFPETFPCFGIYRVGPEFYDDRLPAWPHHSWYLLEYLPELG